MAQTRACSRVCRNAYAYIVVLMNARHGTSFETTPAEEMTGASEQPARQPLPKAPKPPAKANGKAPAPAGPELVTGFVSRVWDHTYQDKRYWFAKLDKGQQIQTSDPELGGQLLGCETGEDFRAWCEPSPKPGKYYLKSFENTPAEASA